MGCCFSTDPYDDSYLKGNRENPEFEEEKIDPNEIPQPSRPPLPAIRLLDTLREQPGEHMCVIEVNVMEGQKLKKLDVMSETDGYVKIFPRPCGEELRTRIIDNDPNPQWNEVLRFETDVTRKPLSLYIEVCDYDVNSRDDFVGMQAISLDDMWDNTPHDMWLDLRTDNDEADATLGRLHLSIKCSIFKVEVKYG